MVDNDNAADDGDLSAGTRRNRFGTGAIIIFIVIRNGRKNTNRRRPAPKIRIMCTGSGEHNKIYRYVQTTRTGPGSAGSPRGGEHVGFAAPACEVL